MGNNGHVLHVLWPIFYVSLQANNTSHSANTGQRQIRKGSSKLSLALKYFNAPYVHQHRICAAAVVSNSKELSQEIVHFCVYVL